MNRLKRYAIYLIPREGTHLARLGSALLGRHSETGLPVKRPQLNGLTPKRLATMTSSARRYGLHVTLKAPFFLNPEYSEDDLLLHVRNFARQHSTLTLPRLVLSGIGSFFVLIPATDTPPAGLAAQQLHMLANDAVREFDHFRAVEGFSRETRGLTLRQQQNLQEWGYPYVFDDHRSHFTVTDRLRSSAESRHLEELLAAFFTPALDEPLVIDSLCLCIQEADAQSELRNQPQLKPPFKEPFFLQERFALKPASS